MPSERPLTTGPSAHAKLAPLTGILQNFPAVDQAKSPCSSRVMCDDCNAFVGRFLTRQDLGDATDYLVCKRLLT